MLFRSFFVVTHIRAFSGTPCDSFSTIARILPFPGTDRDSVIFRYSHRFDHFPVLPGTVFRHTHRFYLFPVLTRMMPFWVVTQIRAFSGTPKDSFSTLTQILHFPGTDLDSGIFRYSHRLDPFPVLPGTVIRQDRKSVV